MKNNNKLKYLLYTIIGFMILALGAILGKSTRELWKATRGLGCQCHELK